MAVQVKWGTLLALSGGTGFYYWLVFEELSWDIMEPITFFTGVGVGLIGYVVLISSSALLLHLGLPFLLLLLLLSFVLAMGGGS